MKKLSEKIVIIASAVIFFGLLSVPVWQLISNQSISLIQGNSGTTWAEQSKKISFKDKTPIGQTFLAETNNLAQIAVRLHRSSNLSEKYNFILEDRSQPNPIIIKQGQFITSTIFRTAYFRFDPIPGSANKKFYFYVIPESSNPKLSFLTSETPSKSGDLYLNHQLKSSDLVFQIYYHQPRTFFKSVWRLLENLSQYKPAFIKFPWLVGYLLMFIGSLIAVIYYLIAYYIKSAGTSLQQKTITLIVMALSIITVLIWLESQHPVFYLK